MIPATQHCALRAPAVTATAWHDALAGAAAGAPRDGCGYAVRTFSETPCAVLQPVLTDDILCLHGGGAKRVHRRHHHALTVHDIDCNALTLMPRGQANRWQTFGPIDYVHLMPATEMIGEFAREELDCDRDSFEFRDDVGFRDPLIEALFRELALQSQKVASKRLYTDSLLTALVGRLVVTRSNLSPRRLADHQRSVRSTNKGGLPDWRLRRITEYLREHLADDIALAELGAIVGVSRAQLFRAFRQSTGTTPARYLTDLRIEHAKGMMLEGAPIDDVARATGFSSSCGFDVAFRRCLGRTPKQFIRDHR